MRGLHFNLCVHFKQGPQKHFFLALPLLRLLEVVRLPLKTATKHLSSWLCKWQGTAWMRGLLVQGHWWKYESEPSELATHCCATAHQQVLVSFWYLMVSKSWQEILLSSTRQALLLVITAKKQKLKSNEKALKLKSLSLLGHHEGGAKAYY